MCKVKSNRQNTEDDEREVGTSVMGQQQMPITHMSPTP